MGHLEKELKKDIRRTKINSAVIKLVATAVVLPVVVITAPALGIISKYNRQRTYALKSTLSRLIKGGYLILEQKGNKKFVRLTSKGERFAAQLGEGKFAIKKPKRWDGKWRVLIFDIPERRRGTRTKIRNNLESLGLHRLQDSVWVYPYDCEDIVTLLKAEWKVGKDLLYLIVEKLEYDAPLRKKFKLA